jgi:carbamoyltransferase
MRDRLNLEIKRREPFRPFGCSILREHVSDWFECDDDSPYMLRIVRALPERRSAIASALHVDGTSRLHTVSRAHAPRFARLLDLLVERGHPPLLINTSLNGPGEPIVHTAEQAFATAHTLGLDALVIEGVLHTTTGVA